MGMDPGLLLSSKIVLLKDLLDKLDNSHNQAFFASASILAEALRQGNTIFWCGNGGSAAESSHLAAELIGRFRTNRRPLPSISLNSDTSVLTCIANDFGYEEVFSRQLEGLAKENDVLIVLTTSGRSENVLQALRRAKELGVITIGLLGKGGGPALDLVDQAIVIESNETARIQELHLLLGHTLCEYVEIELGFDA
jgi:D-sedoheptulose 7-phosphate isomerase